MSTGYPLCDSDCPSIITCLAHLCLLYLMFDNICHTTLFPDPVCTLSVLEGDFCHDSLHHPLGCDQFLQLGVTKRPGLIAIRH